MARFKIEIPTLQDIKGMLDLNYKIYPKEWHVDFDYVEKIMKKNHEVYRVLHVDRTVKGIYSLFPLDQNSYEAVLSGTLNENQLFNNLLDYDKPKEVYLYLISIIVDIFDTSRKSYTKAIIKDIPHQLNQLQSKGIDVKQIGAIAITEDGAKILRKIGLKNDGEEMKIYDDTYPVFRGKPEDMIKAIKV